MEENENKTVLLYHFQEGYKSDFIHVLSDSKHLRGLSLYYRFKPLKTQLKGLESVRLLETSEPIQKNGFTEFENKKTYTQKDVTKILQKYTI